ncbi:MAG: phage major capsid protein [Sphingomonadales bacterium]|nr:phage major capsid protein [Sphingomonadales bacterium]MDE2171183.1 phage major capsid protein [Sphingomonadales bacterium]
MINDLLKKRAAAFDSFKALADKPGILSTEDQAEYETQQRAVQDYDAQIARARQAQALSLETAKPVDGQDNADGQIKVRERDPYSNEDDAKAMGLTTCRGLRAIASLKMFNKAGGVISEARNFAASQFGERHPITRSFEPRIDPVTRALVTSVGASGGFIVPPDYMNEIIELLRPKAVVRASGPRVLPMPRGTMTLPGQASAATAGYGNEQSPANQSQQSLNQIVATFKKLMGLVPVSNDMMRYSDPAVDAFVRDDLVKVLGLAEDFAFMFGQGTQDQPMGFLYFANRWVQRNGGTPGVWSTSGNSTAAVNGTDPANSTGGNFITSNETYTLATAAAELGGAVNRLDAANVPDDKRVWFMNPRSYNYLYNVQNSLGLYVYRDELMTGKLLGYPVRKTTQIPTNYHDASSTNNDCSFVFLVEMDEAMILDSMSLELAVSREGMYVDAGGTTRSAFQSDQTIIRAITEHDFQMRHDQSIAVIQFVRWAPAIS